MKLIWSPAVTLDGNIATADGNSDWPTDTDGEQFNELTRHCKAVIVGRATFDQYQGKVFPINGATTFVWTSKPENGRPIDGVEYVNGTPEEVIKLLDAKGFNACVLAGGTKTNNAFVGAGVIRNRYKILKKS